MNDIKDLDNSSIVLTCRSVEQNQQGFFVGVFAVKDLLVFTKYTYRIIEYFDENGLPRYNDDIQRKIDKSRTEMIADFLINDPEATFPTNLVLHIPQAIIEHQEVINYNGLEWINIYLSNKVKEGVEKDKRESGKGDVYITVIDGQHRIKGIEIAIDRLESEIMSIIHTFKGRNMAIDMEKKLVRLQERLHDLKNIQVVVTFFVDKPLEYQAMIFSTINRTQKKVTESLVYELFGLNTNDSPQKSSLQIVHALNGLHNSPFYKRVKLYGWTNHKEMSPPLSEATMVRSIINLICDGKREEEIARFKPRNLFLDEKVSDSRLPFRKYYGKDEDIKISKILLLYFSSVRETFFDKKTNIFLWDLDIINKKLTNVLQTTVGYQAFLLLLVEIIQKNKNEADYFDKNYFNNVLGKAKHLNFYDLNRYPLTSKSKQILYCDLSLAIFPTSNIDDNRKAKLRESGLQPLN